MVFISDMRNSENREIFELFATEDHRFVNVLWWNNVLETSDDPPKISRFVSVVDKTTARMMSESFLVAITDLQQLLRTESTPLFPTGLSG